MDLNTIFQKIRARATADDKAVFLIVTCFLIIALAKVILGFIPWYFLIVMLPMFFASLLRPKAGLYGLIFLTVLFERFFTLEALQFGKDVIKLYPLDVVLFGVYGGVLVNMMHTNVHLIRSKAGMLLSLFFVLASGYLVASFMGFGSQDISVAFSTWKNYVFYGMLFFASPFILESESDVKQVVKYFLSAAVIGILFLIIGVVRGEGLWTEFTPLSTAGVRLLAFPHAFYFSLAFLGIFVTAEQWSRSKYRAFVWIVLALWMFGILGSLMRHMWIGMFLAGCFTWIFLIKENGRTFVKKMIMVAVSFGMLVFSCLLFLSFVLPTSTVGHVSESSLQVVSARVASIGNAADTSISWRGSTWQSAFSRLSQNLFFGSGFGGRIPVESGDYRDFVEIRNIHNSWLALLVQMGSVGFLVVASSLGFLVLKVLRLHPETAFLSAMRIALLTVFVYFGIVLFAQPYLETNLTGIFFWLTLGLMHTTLYLSEKKIIAQE